MKEQELKDVFYKEDVREFSKILKVFYKNSKDYCFIRVLSKKSNKSKAYPLEFFNKAYNIKAIENFFKKEDLMFSLNVFKTLRSGRRDNIFCINNLAVDIDYKKIKEFKDLTPNQVIHLLELDFFDQAIPTPNFIEYGNQIRLIYNLKETVYIPKGRFNALILAERISKVFSKRLEDYGAEEQKLESYFRKLNSINSKNNSKIKMVEYVNSISYTLKELQEIWLDDLPKWYERRKIKTKIKLKTNKSKVIKLHNLFYLNSNRLLDFEKIQEYLNDNNTKDLRERLCFLYRNYVLLKIKSTKKFLEKEDFNFAKEEMLRFNMNFKHPLRENIIESSTRCVNRNQYIYKNETLINFLELDFVLCKKLNLQSIYIIKDRKEIQKDYYKKVRLKRHKKYLEKLKEENKLTRTEKISLRRKKIKLLLKRGLRQKDIISLLSISRCTLISDIKTIKEQGCETPCSM